MTKENVDGNKEIVFLKDEKEWTFRAIALFLSMNGRPIAESNVRKIYRRTKKKDETDGK